ncbi:hypothetical protein SLH49_16195 [Cognatiyoonia sp. IB215446]|uniref:hypothetical protein n=1 Tax=Cognatiyoonia sp. IB215446 TaxID=3097355 RepID=UPI002A181EE6|nr:hypothetical protein [Cognatiyoonia sp. IB215446]MDX8349525.1 hypothetical protein [Cognatiyoonia sp. IB215446]
MLFEWPTPDQMLYRVMRLRRLVALAIAIPVGVMLIGAAIDPAFLAADRATLGALAVAVMVVGHVMLFPNVPTETLSLSIGVTGLVLAAPWIKSLAWMAPAENASAAYTILVGLALLGAGGVMALSKALLSMLVYAGPAIKLRVKASMDLPCSTSVARRQFALQPATRRGRILCGVADSDGLFDVAIVAPQVADPDNPDQPFVARLAAKVLHSDETSHQVMLVLGDGQVAATSQTFTATDEGCRVEMVEMPGDFTLGMHAMYWLTDQQADNMTECADTILSEPARANGLSHGVSLLSLAGAVLSPRAPVADRAK